jgi:hypothetical protein
MQDKWNTTHSELNFLKIEVKNNLIHFNEESLMEMKCSLMNLVNEEVELCEEIVIQKFLAQYINFHHIKSKGDQRPDFIQLSTQLSSDYIKEHYQDECEKKANTKLSEEAKICLDNVLNRDYHMEFVFLSSLMDELVKIIIFAYSEMKLKGKIKDCKRFQRSLSRNVQEGLDAIKLYKDREKEHFNSDSKSTFSDSSSSTAFTNKSNPQAKKSFLGKLFPFLEKVEQPQSELEQFLSTVTIPLEMLVLREKFQTIKKLKLFIPNNVPDIRNYLLIMLNFSWLFPNLLEVDLDLSCINIQKDMLNKSEHTNLIKSYRKNFELMIIASSYIQDIEKLKFLSLIFNDSFSIEMNSMITNDYQLNFKNFHFLNFYKNFYHLLQFKAEFNSLDKDSFSKIISIIHESSKLKCLKLSLFNSEEYYSVDLLSRFCRRKSIFRDIENKEGLVDHFSEQLCKNLENLFYILYSKTSLHELCLHGNLPGLISNNEKYIILFQKFLFNIFTMLNIEICGLNTLHIAFPDLSFDNRRYPSISKFLEILNLSERNSKLINFTLLLQFNKISNIGNILSPKLKYLHLGDLDLDTFNCLITYFKLPQFYKNSKMETLKLKLRDLIQDPKQCFDNYIIEFLKIRKPFELREIYLYTNIVSDENEYCKIQNAINYDFIERYSFEFNKRSSQQGQGLKQLENELYYFIGNKTRNLKIINSLMQIFKNHANPMRDNKLFLNVNKFLSLSHKKEVNINFKR